ncbi:MAG: IreB family regulatory phosphoprotein [Clostridiales bacterium]|nr:IreB family regulatory phosphoprotein [Clostridiales bacterium]
MTHTQTFTNFEKAAKNEAKDVLLQVCAALKEKSYNPVNQIVGYILSGDPTYITSHRNARSAISAMERDELLEELVTFYLKNNDV